MGKKYQIKEHGNGVFEVVVSSWVWMPKPYLLMALEEISVGNIVTAVQSTSGWAYHYIICTMSRQK